MPLLEGHKTKNFVRVLRPPAVELIEPALDSRRLEQAVLDERRNRKRIANVFLQVAHQPGVDWHHEAFLGPANHLLREVTQRSSLEQVLRLPFANLPAA